MHFSVRWCFSECRDFTDPAEDRDLISAKIEHVRGIVHLTHTPFPHSTLSTRSFSSDSPGRLLRSCHPAIR